MSLQLMCSEEQLLPGWDLHHHWVGTLPLAGPVLAAQQLPKRGSERRAGRNHSGPWQAVTEDFFFFSPGTRGLVPGAESPDSGWSWALPKAEQTNPVEMCLLFWRTAKGLNSAGLGIDVSTLCFKARTNLDRELGKKCCLSDFMLKCCLWGRETSCLLLVQVM